MHTVLSGLLLARCNGLLHALGGARGVWLGLHLDDGSLYGLVRDNDVLELVLGDDVDGVRVCRV